MKGLVVTASTGLREELRGLSRVGLVKRCAAFRPVGHDEIAVTKTSMRMLARRIRSLEAEINEVDKALKVLVLEVAPQLVDEFGVGPVCAALRRCTCRGPTRVDAETRRRSLVSSASHPSKRPAARPGTVTGSTAVATVNSTGHCTPSSLSGRDMTPTHATASPGRSAEKGTKRYVASRLYRLLENPPRKALDDL